MRPARPASGAPSTGTPAPAAATAAAPAAAAPAGAADVATFDGARHPDPRSVLLMLLAGNAIAMGNLPTWVCIAVGAVACLLHGIAGRPRRIAWTAVLVAVFGSATILVPQVTEGTGWALLGVACLWFTRFTVTVSLGLWAIWAIRPAELMAALRALRCPTQLLIPVAVVLRMLPVIMREARAITEVMSLRGIRPGALGMMAHPLRYGELVLVPLLSTVVRAGDDLAAAAIIRGLGADSRQTTITELRFRAMDALLLALVAALIVLAVLS